MLQSFHSFALHSILFKALQQSSVADEVAQLGVIVYVSNEGQDSTVSLIDVQSINLKWRTLGYHVEHMPCAHVSRLLRPVILVSII